MSIPIMKRRKYTRWTKEVLEPIVKESISYAQCLDKMGLVKAGGNYDTITRLIEKFDLDASHFLGQAHNLGKELVPFDGLMKKSSIKKRILKERRHQCEECGNIEWNNQIIPLELEHIDGNNRNNSRENLKLLCPNCHAQTKTYRNRKRCM